MHCVGVILWGLVSNPIKHKVFDMQISKALNDQHDQNSAEQHIVHNLRQAFCRLIDRF